MCFSADNPVTLIVEISELFQEILKLAAVEGVITSWCLEVRLENVKADISVNSQTEQLRCLHALNSFILKVLEQENHDGSSDSCNCGWDLTQIPDFQHHDIDRYTPGTIIRWSQGECHVLLAPSETYEDSPNTEEIISQEEEDCLTAIKTETLVIQETNEDNDSQNVDEVHSVEKDLLESNNKDKGLIIEQEKLASPKCLLDISQSQREELKDSDEQKVNEKENSFENSFESLLSGTSDDEDNSCMLIINEDGVDDESNKADNDKDLEASSHIKPFTETNVFAHALQESALSESKDVSAEDQNNRDDDDSSSVSSSSTSSTSSSSSSSTSSSDDDDRINFKKRIEQAAQAARKAAAINETPNQKSLNIERVSSKNDFSDLALSLQLNSDETSEINSNDDIQKLNPLLRLPTKRHPEDIQAAQVLSTLGGKRQDYLSFSGQSSQDYKQELLALSASSKNFNKSSSKLFEKFFEVRRLGNQSFQCGLCGKMFNRMVKVLEHYLSHTGEKPWHCGSCDKKFKNSYSLQKHSRAKHLANHLQQFSCKVCNKSFGVQSTLQTHLATHSASKPFMCSICGRTFALKFTRDSHEFQHTGKRPWSCNVCSKSYITKYKLKAHMKAHTGELICEVCGDLFGSQDALTRHRKRHETKLKNGPTKNIRKRKSSFREPKLVNDSVVKPAPRVDSKTASSGAAYETSSLNSGLNASAFRCQMCGQVFLKSTCLTHHLASCNALTYCPPSSSVATPVENQSQQEPQLQLAEPAINPEQSHSALSSTQHLDMLIDSKKENLFPLYGLPVSESIVGGLDNRPFAPLTSIPEVAPSGHTFQQNETILESSSEAVTKALPDFLQQVAFGNSS